MTIYRKYDNILSKGEVNLFKEICETKLKNETHVIIRFVAEVIGGEIIFDSKEIIDVKWIDIDIIKTMTEKELRNYEVGNNIIKDYIEKNLSNRYF